jgi:hypothetical protein
MTDIVERLRAVPHRLEQDTADEIERLRTEVANLGGELNRAALELIRHKKTAQRKPGGHGCAS